MILNKRKWRRKRRVPQSEQMNQYECGICCLKMMLSYYYYEIDMPDLREHFGDGRDGINLLKLKHVANHFKLDAVGKKLSVNDLLTMKFPLPAILHFENKHFVILEKVKKHKFFIVDPARGKITLSLEEFNEKYSNVALFLWPNSTFQMRKRYLNFDFIKSVLKFKNLLVSIFIFSLILQLLAVGVPMAIKYLIDSVMVEGESHLFSLFIYGFLAIILFQIMFTAIKNYLVILLQNKMDIQLMDRFLAHLLKLPYKFFETRSRGDLIYRANSNIQIREFLSQQLISSIINLLLIVVIFSYMLLESVVMAISILTIGILQILIVGFSQAKLKSLTQTQVSDQANTSSFMTEVLGGMSTVKALGIEPDIFQKWKKVFGRQINSTKKQEVFRMKIDLFTNTLNFLTPLAIIAVGITLVTNEEMTIGTLFAFQSLAITFLTPLQALATLISDLVSIETLLARIYDVLNTPIEDSKGKNANQLKGDIVLSNVSFKYNQYGDDVIKDISLEIKAGQKIAIVGSSGSGKSTLAALLAGLYSPTDGTIRFDGLLFDDLNKRSFRRQVGIVLQENYLFNKTVFENITIHKPDTTMEEVIYAAKLAAIHDDIISLPMGYDTIISETGSNFSGGQKQRISIARALVTKPSILLFDEATSALDSITESEIDQNLFDLKCTRIFIAHRLTTIKNADLIVVMNNGRIIDKGSHEELIERSDFYKELYKYNQPTEVIEVSEIS